MFMFVPRLLYYEVNSLQGSRARRATEELEQLETHRPECECAQDVNVLKM